MLYLRLFKFFKFNYHFNYSCFKKICNMVTIKFSLPTLTIYDVTYNVTQLYIIEIHSLKP